MKIKISKLKTSPFQGRLIRPENKKGTTDDQHMKMLMESISQHGLLSPVLVRQVDGGYEVIDGHRRIEAMKRLKMETVDTIVHEADDKKTQAMSIIANLHRKNLSTIEKALTFQKVLKSQAYKSKKELSKAIGKDETFVGDILSTLKMDQRIIDDLLQNQNTEDVRLLRAIRKYDEAVNNKSDKQWEIYRRFVDENLTRGKVLGIVKEGSSKEQDQSSVRVEKKGKRTVFQIQSITDDQAARIQQLIKDFLNRQ